MAFLSEKQEMSQNWPDLDLPGLGGALNSDEDTRSYVSSKGLLGTPVTCSLLLPTGMRILVTLLLDTLPMLGNVLLLCFFVFFIFGIVGVQLWAGLLRNRCFLDSNFAM